MVSFSAIGVRNLKKNLDFCSDDLLSQDDRLRPTTYLLDIIKYLCLLLFFYIRCELFFRAQTYLSQMGIYLKPISNFIILSIPSGKPTDRKEKQCNCLYVSVLLLLYYNKVMLLQPWRKIAKKCNKTALSILRVQYYIQFLLPLARPFCVLYENVFNFLAGKTNLALHI